MTYLEAAYGDSSLFSRVREDYERMKPWLPKCVTSILDIGCGPVPLLDLLLGQHYGGAVDFHLMDGRARSIRKFKTYAERAAPWDNRQPAVAALREAFPEALVEGHEPDPSLTIPVDLIVSRRAWGHHFSIAMYIELVKRSLRSGGRVITDIRTGTDGLKTFLRNGFSVLSDDLECRSGKCKRYALARK